MAEVTAEQVRAAVHAAAPEAPVEVMQTGGGIATVFVGTPDKDDRYWLSIGPGWYHWTEPWHSGFELDGMSIGHDDEGITDSTYIETLDDITRYVAGEKEARS